MHLILLIAAGIFLGVAAFYLAPMVVTLVIALLVGTVSLIVWGTVSMTDWIVHTLRRLLLGKKK